MSDNKLQETVVIFRLGSLGDTIVALPCFHAIRRRFPKAHRIVLTNVPVSSKAAPLLGVLGNDGQFVDGAVEYPVGLRSLGGLLALRRRLRALGSTTLVYLMPERGAKAAWRDWLFLRACGFSRILAFPASGDLRHTRVAADGILEPEAERLVRCCTPDLGPIDLKAAKNWDLELTGAELAAGQAATAGLGTDRRLVINMGGKAVKNDWGHENWKTLIPRLGRLWPDMALMVVGAPDDVPRAEEILALWPGPRANLCGRLSPRESAAAMAGATAFIGHDSGPMHLAAAMQVPVLGLFGDNNPPRKWHPIGPRVSVIHRMQGISAIRVEEVEQAARGLVDGADLQPRTVD